MYRLLLTCISTLLVLSFWAQESQSGSLIRPSITASLLNGGQATSSTFYFKSGFGAYVSFRYQPENAMIYPALFTGVERLSEEILLPVGFEYHIRLKEKLPAGFLSLSGGYAFGFNNQFEEIDGYEYYGGVFFNPGWGYAWPLNEKNRLEVAIRYRHQFLRTEFYKDGLEQYTNNYEYMMLQLSAGIHF